MYICFRRTDDSTGTSFLELELERRCIPHDMCTCVTIVRYHSHYHSIDHIHI